MPKDKEEKKVEAETKEQAKEIDPIEDLKKQLADAKVEIEKWKNSYYLAYADMKNLRNALEKEQADMKKYRAIGFVEELLPVLDSFHVVLANEPDDPKLANYLIGFKFIYQNMLRALEAEGVTEIAPQVGDDFNEGTMNAVDSVVEEPINKIKKVSANGYKLHDRLIRPAQVTVSVAKPAEDKKESSEAPKEEKNETKSDA